MFSLAIAAAVAGAAPTGATVEPAGYWTVRSAPLARFTPVHRKVQPKSPEQIAAEKQFSRVANWQAEVRNEVDRLRQRLERDEKGNFVSLRFDNEGEPSVIFAFLRNGPASLRRYSQNPRFRGETVRWSVAEQAAAADKMMAFLNSERISFSGGYGNAKNNVALQLAVTRADYEAAARRRGFVTPDPVELSFARHTSADLNQPLLPAIAPHIRYFARSAYPLGPVNDINTPVRVVLEDGCFRLADEERAHVQFPLGYQLFVDDAGYVSFGDGPAPGYARVGEPAVFHGSRSEITDPGVVDPIVRACGPGKVVAVNALKSAAADRAQDIASDHDWLRRSLPESYGLSVRATEAFIRDCAARFGGRCITTPPRPATGPCPAGTSRSFGMCRTPQGHIRPVPKELQPYLDL